LLQTVGAKAVATTSAGVSWSHACADGGHLTAATLLATVAEIARVVQVPITVDCEAGYSNDASAVAELVMRVLDLGAVGINLEDGTDPPELLCSKIEAVKRDAARAGVDVFVNARVDVYLRGLVESDRRVEETLERAARYEAAGADGIFVPRIADPAEIRTVVAAIRLPLNVLFGAGMPSSSELLALGVRRLSVGSELARAAFGRARGLAAEFLERGSFDGSEPLTSKEINGLMAG
jgi:2-methylisocitrate lyase-like PEP mutase family enzyme